MIKLRQSLFNDYKRCPLLCLVNWGDVGEFGKCEDREREDAETNKYAMTGIVLHEVMEQWCLDKKHNSLKNEDVYHNLLDNKLDSVDLSLFEDEAEREVYRDSLHEQLDWLFEQADSNEILEAEYNFDIAAKGIFEEIDIPINGTVDRITGNLAKKHAVLEDWKTGKPYTKKSLNTNIQAGLYTMAFYRIYGFLPEKFVFYFSKHKKKMTIWITPEFLQDVGAEILSIWFKMKRGEFEANNSNKYFCKNFCTNYKECPKFKKVKGWDI